MCIIVPAAEFLMDGGIDRRETAAVCIKKHTAEPP
jgi:hypothetical protein